MRLFWRCSTNLCRKLEYVSHMRCICIYTCTETRVAAAHSMHLRALPTHNSAEHGWQCTSFSALFIMKPVFQLISMDLLWLRVVKMPRSRDLVIFVLTTDRQNGLLYPLHTHTLGVTNKKGDIFLECHKPSSMSLCMSFISWWAGLWPHNKKNHDMSTCIIGGGTMGAPGVHAPPLAWQSFNRSLLW